MLGFVSKGERPDDIEGLPVQPTPEAWNYGGKFAQGSSNELHPGRILVGAPSEGIEWPDLHPRPSSIILARGKSSEAFVEPVH